jgi:hypothetical protein
MLGNMWFIACGDGMPRRDSRQSAFVPLLVSLTGAALIGCSSGSGEPRRDGGRYPGLDSGAGTLDGATNVPDADFGDGGPTPRDAGHDAQVTVPCSVHAECGDQGQCVMGACQCDAGYAGIGCAACATGYARTAAAEPCLPLPDAGDADCGAVPSCTGVDGDRIEQWGGAVEDALYGVAVGPSGEAVVVGVSDSDLGGGAQGLIDLLLEGRHASPSSNWVRQWGTAVVDSARAVAVAPNGSIYVAGYTWGGLGSTVSGQQEPILTLFDAAHTSQWTKGWGTDGRDQPEEIALASNGDVLVLGWTTGDFDNPGVVTPSNDDVFITRLSAAGDVIWTTQIGSDVDEASGGLVELSNGDWVVVGSTSGTLVSGQDDPGWDAFCVTLSSAGAVKSSVQWGGDDDQFATGVALLPDGKLAIAGADDAESGSFVMKAETDCTEIWKRDFGVGPGDRAFHVKSDTNGAIYVAGETGGNLVPTAYVGLVDAYLTKRDASGEEIWTRQVGSTGQDRVYDLAVAPDGTAYVVGWASGALPARTFQGGIDNFLLVFAPTSP